MIESKVRRSQKEAAGTEILVAAEELLLAHGAHAVNMAAIAKRAGIAVGTLYNYFTDKEDLLKTLLETRRLEMTRVLDTEIAAIAGQPFEDRLRAVLRVLFNQDPMRVRFRNLMRVSFDELGASASDSMHQTFAKWMEPIVEAGIREGTLRECPAEMQSLILVAIIKVAGEKVVTGDFTNEKAAELVTKSFLHGHARPGA
jgi:AcrR family transcriptional regulator